MSMDKISFIKKYKRIFLFGCSFTHYYWDTWADILQHDVNIVNPSIEIYNYGVQASSNQGIARRVHEANILHNFTEDDAVLIVWSSWSREERYKNGWIRTGNIYNRDPKFAKNYWNPAHEFIQNSIAIVSTNIFLKEKLIFQGHMTQPDIKSYKLSVKQEIVNFYLPHLKINFPSFDGHQTYKNSSDRHPTVLDHINFVTNNIFNLEEETQLYYKKYHANLIEIFRSNRNGVQNPDCLEKVENLSLKNRKHKEFY